MSKLFCMVFLLFAGEVISDDCLKYFMIGSKSYFLNLKQQEWSDAQTMCESLPNGRLLKIESEWENNDLEMRLREYQDICYDSKRKVSTYWTSGMRSSETKFHWQTNPSALSIAPANMKYTNWNTKEPNNFGNNENCMEAMHYDNKLVWNDIACQGYTLCSICEVAETDELDRRQLHFPQHPKWKNNFAEEDSPSCQGHKEHI